ncbi:MAG: type III glutamate--ammonia ligase [Arenicellales bacterium]|jgi:glutamine synthetase|nr:type III glutamate--ammonia ligase [Arenicellales bacterium]MDP7517190.1 type III glutamate--ammonia ligase [Arenicellales bacterium]MDP7617502.1 type III glutamate--ammonia ligase [Arenicellales bacterium]HJL53374.1 type III glutamate--ammonia ligase [Arenicellales bacterium]|tara:strand:- start:538 stop:1845 length:1308 start_codon:yes stop_codon:yes gene_type:complete
MPTNLSKVATERGIKYFLISFVDLFGSLRSKLVPARAIADMQKDGAGFAGFAAWLDMTPADSDMFSVPDPDSLIQLPWKPEVGWLAGDLAMDGKPVEASPRVALKQQIARAENLGFRMKTGVECEYFLVSADGSSIFDPNDTQEKPCYDQSALMRQYDVISEICDSMIELGWGPYQNDHEDANGQFEMNWDYDDALVTADRHVFFKYMVKAITEKHGLRATFMPKPFSNLTGNGCHAHVSVWDKTGQNNLFEDSSDEMGLSTTAYHFLGGILHNAQALTAVFNPTVNSYKRIDAQVTTSGATWSPNAVTYGGNNRTHMVRIPDKGRFELRLMDGAANPYLLQAGVLAAGLDGVENERDPGKRLDINMYTDGHKIRGLRRLPANLLDAIRLFEKSKVLRSGLGDALVDSYSKLKYQDWRNYSSAISQWERDHTLDC